MITTCTICQARYRLDDTKVPKKVIRVRCPGCSGVFVLDGTAAPLVADIQVESTTVPEPSPTFETQSNIPTPVAETAPEVVNEDAWEIPEVPEVPATTTLHSAAEVAIEPEEAPANAKKRRRRCKEEMLARALVSDILVYNRDLRDTAIKDGRLLEALGGEIKKSWELYKEKVTPDVANSTNHFREALNEILAEGEKVF